MKAPVWLKWLLHASIFSSCILSLGGCQSFGGASNAPPIDEGEFFVQVRGPNLYLGGQPYYFAGANFWYGAYLGLSAQGKARLVSELDQLKAMGITNLRVLAGSERSRLSMAVSPAVMESPNVYNESLLVSLDFFLHELAKRDMKAVLYFSNFWQWSGGMAQLVAWAEGGAAPDPDVTGDWNGFMQYSAKFYSNSQAKQWLASYIAHLVNRKNTLNGKQYKNDTAIMTWELANEPRPGSDQDGHNQYDAFKGWISETAALIKSLDANHLVATGNEGSMGTSRSLENFVDSHRDQNVDYLTFHLWPKNWSWYDAKNPQDTFSRALAKSKAYVFQHIQLARQLNKPIVLEEFGLERDAGGFGPATSTQYRDDFLKEIFNLLEQQVKIGAPIAGSNVWAWSGAGRAQRPTYLWRYGDTFTGDPPQEPQGLNSIFDTDVSTIGILSSHAKALKALRKTP